MAGVLLFPLGTPAPTFAFRDADDPVRLASEQGGAGAKIYPTMKPEAHAAEVLADAAIL